MIVSVIGAGKMGLPLAVQIAANGARVWACDVDHDLVATINRGECPFAEPGVPELLSAARAAGSLEATSDTKAAVGESDAVIVIVPALLTHDNEVDLSILIAATDDIAAGLRDGVLVSYETTVPVGTTRNVLGPRLGDRSFHLAFSPERVKSGLVIDRLTQTPKVVGGADAAAAAAAEAFYARYLGAPVINVGSLEAAEFVKLAGMVYRDVSIALANELSRYAEAAVLDLPALTEAINTNGEAHILQPGIGVGGHCTPVYPYFLINDAAARRVDAPVARQARAVNDGQAEHHVARLAEALDGLDGQVVTILGLGFRPGVKEDAMSPAYLLDAALRARNAVVRLADPLYRDDEIRAHGFEPGAVDSSDAVVLSTAHPEFKDIDWAAARGRLRVVLDGRNTLDRGAIEAHGINYLGVGTP